MYTYLLETLLSILMGRYLEMELLDQMVIPYNSMYDHFLRNHHTDSQSSCTILHPPPHTHTPQHLLLNFLAVCPLAVSLWASLSICGFSGSPIPVPATSPPLIGH